MKSECLPLAQSLQLDLAGWQPSLHILESWPQLQTYLAPGCKSQSSQPRSLLLPNNTCADLLWQFSFKVIVSQKLTKVALGNETNDENILASKFRLCENQMLVLIIRLDLPGQSR